MKKIDENTVPHSIKIVDKITKEEVAMLKLKKGQSAYASDEDALKLPEKYKDDNKANLEVKLYNKKNDELQPQNTEIKPVMLKIQLTDEQWQGLGLDTYQLTIGFRYEDVPKVQTLEEKEEMKQEVPQPPVAGDVVDGPVVDQNPTEPKPEEDTQAPQPPTAEGEDSKQPEVEPPKTEETDKDESASEGEDSKQPEAEPPKTEETDKDEYVSEGENNKQPETGEENAIEPEQPTMGDTQTTEPEETK